MGRLDLLIAIFGCFVLTAEAGKHYVSVGSRIEIRELRSGIQAITVQTPGCLGLSVSVDQELDLTRNTLPSLWTAVYADLMARCISVFECPADGLFPNPENCDSFFRCVSGTPYLQYCPASLKFSKETQECVWPEIANCSEEPGF